VDAYWIYAIGRQGACSFHGMSENLSQAPVFFSRGSIEREASIVRVIWLRSITLELFIWYRPGYWIV
jgi:hypothetical protein